MAVVVETLKISKDGAAVTLEEFDAVAKSAVSADESDAAWTWFNDQEIEGDAIRRISFTESALVITRTWADESVHAEYLAAWSQVNAAHEAAFEAAGFTVVKE